MSKENCIDIDRERNSPQIMAARVDRLFAAIIDTMILGGSSFLLLLALSNWHLDVMYLHAKNSKLEDMLLILGIFILINGYFLHSFGQTVGKKVCQIKIVRRNGGPASFSQILFRRFVPLWLTQLIPGISLFFFVANVVPIFGKSKRCLHDYLADTIVVKVAVDQ